MDECMKLMYFRILKLSCNPFYEHRLYIARYFEFTDLEKICKKLY